MVREPIYHQDKRFSNDPSDQYMVYTRSFLHQTTVIYYTNNINWAMQSAYHYNQRKRWFEPKAEIKINMNDVPTAKQTASEDSQEKGDRLRLNFLVNTLSYCLIMTIISGIWSLSEVIAMGHTNPNARDTLIALIITACLMPFGAKVIDRVIQKQL